MGFHSVSFSSFNTQPMQASVQIRARLRSCFPFSPSIPPSFVRSSFPPPFPPSFCTSLPASYLPSFLPLFIPPFLLPSFSPSLSPSLLSPFSFSPSLPPPCPQKEKHLIVGYNVVKVDCRNTNILLMVQCTSIFYPSPQIGQHFPSRVTQLSQTDGITPRSQELDVQPVIPPAEHWHTSHMAFSTGSVIV